MDTAFQMAEIGQSENSEDRFLAGKALQEALRVAQTAQWAPTSLKTMDKLATYRFLRAVSSWYGTYLGTKKRLEHCSLLRRLTTKSLSWVCTLDMRKLLNLLIHQLPLHQLAHYQLTQAVQELPRLVAEDHVPSMVSQACWGLCWRRQVLWHHSCFSLAKSQEQCLTQLLAWKESC